MVRQGDQPASGVNLLHKTATEAGRSPTASRCLAVGHPHSHASSRRPKRGLRVSAPDSLHPPRRLLNFAEPQREPLHGPRGLPLFSVPRSPLPGPAPRGTLTSKRKGQSPE